MDLQKELKTAKKAAKEAGKIARRYRREGAESWKKADDSIVTEADIDCQRKIIEIIESDFPEDGFLAEEEDTEPDGEDRVWVIDPIDGTENYSRGMDYYCTSIALKVNGELKVGIIYVPENDKMFYAVRGSGAYLNGERIAVSETDILGNSLLALVPSPWIEELRSDALELTGEAWRRDAHLRKTGSAAIHLCNVAKGDIDGYMQAALKEVDLAAGALIVEEAGGEVRWQESVVEGEEEIVASNGKLQQELEDIFDRSFRG